MRAEDVAALDLAMLIEGETSGRPLDEVLAAYGRSRSTYYEKLRRFRDQGLEGLLARPPGPRAPVAPPVEIVRFVVTTRIRCPEQRPPRSPRSSSGSGTGSASAASSARSRSSGSPGTCRARWRRSPRPGNDPASGATVSEASRRHRSCRRSSCAPRRRRPPCSRRAPASRASSTSRTPRWSGVGGASSRASSASTARRAATSPFGPLPVYAVAGVTSGLELGLSMRDGGQPGDPVPARMLFGGAAEAQARRRLARVPLRVAPTPTSTA